VVDVPKIAVACQGGGIHASFAVGVLTEILKEYEKKKFELVGLSGTSAGALCALMVWYGLANKKGPDGSAREGSARAAIRQLNCLMDVFAAKTGSEKVFNRLASLALKAHEMEEPLLGLVPPKLGLNPAGAVSRAVFAAAPYLGLRAEYALRCVGSRMAHAATTAALPSSCLSAGASMSSVSSCAIGERVLKLRPSRRSALRSVLAMTART